MPLLALTGGMPIYEYRCPRGHLFERLQGFTDPAPAGCDVCGAGPVEKVLYPVAVHFKGSGFYSTDYGRGARKRDGSDGGSSGDSGAASSDGAGQSASSDAKSTSESGAGEKRPESAA